MNDLGEDFLLTLLHYAGWTVRVDHGDEVAVRATRAEVVVTAQAATMSAAVGTAFARAMRSSRHPSVY